MPRFLVFSVLILALVACKPPVTATKNGDGSDSVTVNTPDGSATTTTKGDHTSYSDSNGNSINIDGKNGSTEITGKDEKGDFKATAGAEALNYDEFGIKPYPGAVINPQSNSSMETTEGKSVTTVGTTSDSPEKVVEFYRPMIVKKKTETNSDGNFIVGGISSTGAAIYITVTVNSGKTMFSIMASREKK